MQPTMLWSRFHQPSQPHIEHQWRIEEASAIGVDETTVWPGRKEPSEGILSGLNVELLVSKIDREVSAVLVSVAVSVPVSISVTVFVCELITTLSSSEVVIRICVACSKNWSQN